MLECVINVSEGRDAACLAALADAAEPALLDIHADADHHRAVFTLGGDDEVVWRGSTALARAAVSLLDLAPHQGVHPRFGVLDVVPWVDLEAGDVTPRALHWRGRFADWAGAELGVPCFLYGPERSLPDVRRQAWHLLLPDVGPDRPHPTAGSCAVGARPVLVAYNVWLADGNGADARRVAAAVRRPGLRTLGLVVGGRPQVSCNLTDPLNLGPLAAYDLVAEEAPVAGAELVGLVPEAVLAAVPQRRWEELDLGPDRTIEARAAARQ